MGAIYRNGVKYTQTKTEGVTVDEELDTDSVNPVQNKVIAAKINEVIESLGTQVDFTLDGTTLYITTK